MHLEHHLVGGYVRYISPYIIIIIIIIMYYMYVITRKERNYYLKAYLVLRWYLHVTSCEVTCILSDMLSFSRKCESVQFGPAILMDTKV